MNPIVFRALLLLALLVLIFLPPTTRGTYLNEEDDDNEAFFVQFGSKSQYVAGHFFFVLQPKGYLISLKLSTLTVQSN